MTPIRPATALVLAAALVAGFASAAHAQIGRGNGPVEITAATSQTLSGEMSLLARAR